MLKISKVLLLTVLGFLGSNSHAAIISTSGVVNDINGLDWLDLDQTNGLTFLEALDENPGFRPATYSEVVDMFALFATPNDNKFFNMEGILNHVNDPTLNHISTNEPTNISFFNAFGTTNIEYWGSKTVTRSLGWTFDSKSSGYLELFGGEYINDSYSINLGIEFFGFANYGRGNLHLADPKYGHFLVRNQVPSSTNPTAVVSEPSIILIIILGFFGLTRLSIKAKKVKL